MISKLKRTPYIINPHGQASGYTLLSQIFPTPYKLYDILTFRRVLRNATVVIAASTQELKEIKNFGVADNKIKLIPAGINIEFPKTSTKKGSNSTIKLLFIGRISRNRRVELLIKAFKILTMKHKNLELWIVGGEERTSFTFKRGFLRELKDFCKKLKISDRVHFTGQLLQTELIKYYLESDIFIYISDYENFGQTILEAAAAGLPLICSPQGIASEIIEEGKSGFLIDKNPRNIAEKIEYLIVNETERISFGERIRKLVEKKYSWKKITKKYMKLYQSLA